MLPHEFGRREALGLVAAAVAVPGCLGDEDDPAAGDDDSSTSDGDESDDGSSSAETVVTVGPDLELTFEPAEVEVDPGTTVRWVWDSDTHNVVPTSIPEDATWEGHELIENDGFEYEHTFEVPGRYEYQCDPHAPGMAGAVVVSEE